MAAAALWCSLSPRCATTRHRLLGVRVVVFLLLLISLHHEAESLSFHYDYINTTNKADFGSLGDDCHINDHRADLTSDSKKNYTDNLGRLVFPSPMQLWDRATGDTASFTTAFSFGIDAVPGMEVGHGMAFFLTGQDAGSASNVDRDSSGGFLALFSPGNATGAGAERIVAVEFDTVKDPWDPSARHIGVDLNNVTSSLGNYVVLPDDSMVGRVMSARIEYDGGTGRLDVVLRNGSNTTYALSTIVDLRSFLPENVSVGFSAATSEDHVALHYVLSWSFASSPVGDGKRRRHAVSTPVLVGVTVAAVLALVLGTVVGALLWRSRRQRFDEESEDVSSDDDDPWEMEEDLESGSGPRPFQLRKLRAATGNFSEAEKLGQGASGSVYRGRVDDLDVAIKVFSRAGSAQGKREYTAEVTVISRLRHRNLVHLIGWCDGRKKLLLVYELVPNGSLDRHLHHSVSSATSSSALPLLTWPARHRILLGLGAAVLYLHEEWGQCVVHGDIKPSNIMLDESFGAKLGDFGLARLIDHGAGLQTMTAVAGTPGYLDPECIATGKASTESDVYSFGVVLLEVATGRRPMAPPPPGDSRIFRLVEWAWGLYGRGAVLQAADEALLRGEMGFDAREMERALVVGLWCAHPDAAARPSIREAVEALRSGDGEAAKLPALPPRMPVAMYVQPYDPAERYVVDDTTTLTATTSVTADCNYQMSSGDYNTLYSTSSIPAVGSKQSVRLLRGR